MRKRDAEPYPHVQKLQREKFPKGTRHGPQCESNGDKDSTSRVQVWLGGDEVWFVLAEANYEGLSDCCSSKEDRETGGWCVSPARRCKSAMVRWLRGLGGYTRVAEEKTVREAKLRYGECSCSGWIGVDD